MQALLSSVARPVPRAAPPSAAYLQYSSAVKIVEFGNSLMAGLGLESTPSLIMPNQALARAPLVGTGVVSTNVAVSGASFAQLRASYLSAVHAAFDASKTCLLPIWEITNAICNLTKRTPAECIADATGLIADVLAVHPKYNPILLTALPRERISGNGTTQTERDQANADMKTVNDYFLANYLAMGAVACCNVRAGNAFDFPDYQTSRFDATASLWQDPSDRIHTSGAGNTLVAINFCATLAQIPLSVLH
jgi:lysophospholipase L1-like esterase